MSIDLGAFATPFVVDDPFADLPATPGPLGEAEAALRIAAELNSSLKPINAFEVQLVDMIATQTVRIAQVQQQQRDLRDQRARRAALRWDDDRDDDAAALGLTLAKAPEVVARKLRRTSQGCNWLIARWMQLATVVATAGTLDESQVKRALDLLGLPAEFRDGPTPLAVDAEGQLALIQAQVARLGREKAEILGPLERGDRAIAQKGDGPDEGGELAALYQRERGFAVRLEWARE